MSILQIIGRIGLILLAALAVFVIVIAIQERDWLKVMSGFGFMGLLALFGSVLSLAHNKRTRPHVSFTMSAAPGRILLAIGGITFLVRGISDLSEGNWGSATLNILLSLLLLAAMF